MTDTKATSGKVEKSEAEWRRELTPMQYAVLREKATERPFTGEYEHDHTPGTFVCAGCGQAELHAAFTRKSYRRRTRCDPRHDPHGSAVLQVQWSSRTCVRRRPRTHGIAILHQLCGLETSA
jgi:hypothetical protein